MTVVLVVLVWGAAYLALYRYVSKYPEKKICDNVYINVVNVSGMTREEAKHAMEEHFAEDEKQAKRKIRQSRKQFLMEKREHFLADTANFAD